MATDILYTLYRLWCSNNEQYPVAKNTFSQMMKERGFQAIRGYINLNDNQNNKNNYNNADISTQPYDSSSGQNTQPTKSRVRGFAGIAGQTWLNECVQLILTTADSDFGQAKTLFGHMDRLKRDRCVLINSCEEVVKHVSNVSNMTNQDVEVNSSILYSSSDSVQSVQSVLKNKDIVIKLKEKYDRLNKPENINDLDDLKYSMDMYILNEYNNIEGLENMDTKKIIDDYCKTRGW